MPEQPTGGQNPPPAPGSLRQLVQKINPVLKKTLGQIQSLPVFTSQQASPPASGEPVLPPPAPMSTPTKSTALNRTVVDMEACMMVISRAISDKEVKLKELPASTAGPLKYVSDYREAVPCDSQWNNMVGTNRFRVCQQCQLNVYNFEDMEQAEAEELVFKREAKQVNLFFRRKDGRFLIKDCPVAIKRARTMIACAVGGIAVLAGTIAMLCMLPPSPPTVADADAETVSTPKPQAATDSHAPITAVQVNLKGPSTVESVPSAPALQPGFTLPEPTVITSTPTLTSESTPPAHYVKEVQPDGTTRFVPAPNTTP